MPEPTVTPEEVTAALRRTWFPVATVAELDRPRLADLLGEVLVVFRTHEGGFGVLPNRCPHRGAGLAIGEVKGDSIACPYHGWEWRAEDGTCTRIPSLGPGERIPANVATRAYPVREQWGLVWTCLDEPFADLPTFPELEGREWRYTTGEIFEVTAGIGALTENFRDVSHFPFVHRITMGIMEEVVEPLQVRREGIEVFLDRAYSATGGREEAIWKTEEDILFRYHVIAPCFICLEMDYGARGTRFLLNAPAPSADGQSCRIYWVIGVSEGFQDATLEEVAAAETAVYREDMPVLQSLGARELRLDRPETYSTAADRYTLAYRRAFVEYVRRATASGAPITTPEPAIAAGT